MDLNSDNYYDDCSKNNLKQESIDDKIDNLINYIIVSLSFNKNYIKIIIDRLKEYLKNN
jgi:hypothetical protein